MRRSAATRAGAGRSPRRRCGRSQGADVARHPFLDWTGPIAFAHRGSSADAPENTIAAFRHAVDLGYRYLETDVQVTADGVVVVFHDDDLRRIGGRPGVIGELPWRDIESARVHGTEPIPKLDDVLEDFPDVRFNIDCKRPAAAGPLAAAIRRHDALDRVCLASFSDRTVRDLRRELGDRACTSAGTGELAALWLLGRPAGAALAAQIPERRGWIPVLTSRLLRNAHRHGIVVHVWTANEPEDMRRLLELGVDGIMTDRPAVLRDVLVERGLWAP